MSNVIGLLTEALRERGDAPALHIATWRGDRCEVRTTSFAQLRTMIAQAQQVLRQAGVQPGTRLLALADVSAETYAMIVAAVALGGVVVFAPPAQTKMQTLAFVNAQRADFVLVRSVHSVLRVVLRLLGIDTVAVDYAPPSATLQAQPEQTDIEIVSPAGIGEQAALISYSSGTTGAPKPIVRTHAKLARQFALMDKYLHDGGTPSAHEERLDFTYMGVMALFNMGRGWASLIPVNMDFTAADISRELGRLLDRFQPARLTGSGTFAASALRSAQDAGRAGVKFLVLGGAPADVRVLKEIARAAPQARTLIFYGSTEAEPIAIMPVSADVERQYAAAGYPVGWPIAEIELKIDREKFCASKPAAPHSTGEILVKGAHVITADADGWLRTGDTGYLDDAGQLWLTGRVKEAIATDTGALPTYLIEKPINALPAVARAALIRHRRGLRLYIELRDGNALDERLQQALTAVLNEVPLRGVDLRRIDRMPLDSRHRCKINRLVLERSL